MEEECNFPPPPGAHQFLVDEYAATRRSFNRAVKHFEELLGLGSGSYRLFTRLWASPAHSFDGDPDMEISFVREALSEARAILSG